MNLWQQRIHRAGELARRYPVSAELMYFYREIARFQATLPGQDTAPLRDLIRRHPADPLAAFLTRVLTAHSDAAIRAACERCPHCRHAPPRLHTDPEFAHIHLQACDACRTYWKVVDLALDPGAIPEVDDLASVPLDLWAATHGYRKTGVNLFGI